MAKTFNLERIYMKNGNFIFVGGIDGLETLAEREAQWKRKQSEEDYHKTSILKKLGEDLSSKFQQNTKN